MKSCALAVLLAAHAFAAESTLPDFLPPGTKVLFGIHVRRLVDSDLAKKLTGDASPGALTGALPNAATFTAAWRRVVSLTGFDPVKDIDEILIVSAAQGQNPPMLIIARGNFNVERFSAHAHPYHEVPVLVGDQASSGTIALLDSSTAILGEIGEVHAAIDRRGSGGKLSPALAAAAAGLRERYDIWGSGDRLANLVPPSSKPNGLESIDHFQFGLFLTHGLEVAAEVHARTPKDAAKLKESVQFLEGMIKSQPASDSAKFDIHEERGTLKFKLSVSEAEFKKAIEARLAQPVRKVVATGITITAPEAPATTAPARQTPGPSVFTLPGKGQ